MIRARFPRRSTTAAAKVILMRRGSKHVRHARHGVAEMRPASMTDHFFVVCRCGAIEQFTGMEIAQAGGR